MATFWRSTISTSRSSTARFRFAAWAFRLRQDHLAGMIAGFEQPGSRAGAPRGLDVTGVPAYRRPVNMVLQHYALFPHLNVFDNVAFGLRQLSPRPLRIDRRLCLAIVELVRLSGLEQRLTSFPGDSSSGSRSPAP